AVLVAIEAAHAKLDDYVRLHALIDECERDDPRANAEAAVRFAVGCIDRADAIPTARDVTLGFLKEEAGVTPIELPCGERFDPEQHTADAFERQVVRGHGVMGRVVKTEVTGFRDRNGVVLSRAVVTVAG